MKRIFMLFFAAITAFTVSAQDTEKGPIDYNNEGNEFYRNKDYKSAYASYSKAIELYAAEGVVDDNLVYNTGYCAFKSKQYDEAIPLFEQSIANNFKAAKPYVFLSQVYSKKKDLESMEKITLEGLEKYPEDKTLNKLAGICYLKQGLVFYNAGNKIKKAANDSGLNETDAEAFKAEYARADVEFKKALPLMEKAYKYDSKSKNAQKALLNIYTNLEMTAEADKLKAETGL